MLDGDTGNTTSTNVADQVVSAFAALREAGPEVEAEEAAEAVETETPGEPEVPETVPEAEPVKERILFKIGDEEVDEDTLIEARKSGLRQADYTKKTQELSAKAQKLEQERAAEREQTLKHWKALEDAYASVAAPKEPDWVALQAQVRAGQLAEEDYNRFAASWLQDKTQRDQIAAERQKAEEAVKADKQKAAEATAQANFEKVLDLLPEWKDEGKRQSEWKEMVGYVKSIAPDLDESALLGAHPALFKAISDAHKYHKLQQNTGKPKVVKVDATLKPGSPSQPKSSGSDTALRRVAQTHSDADGVAAFRELRKKGAY